MVKFWAKVNQTPYYSLGVFVDFGLNFGIRVFDTIWIIATQVSPFCMIKLWASALCCNKLLAIINCCLLMFELIVCKICSTNAANLYIFINYTCRYDWNLVWLNLKWLNLGQKLTKRLIIVLVFLSILGGILESSFLTQFELLQHKDLHFEW